MMALRITGRNKVIIDDSVNPIYRVMIHSYTRNLQIELEETHCADGLANRDEILAQARRPDGGGDRAEPELLRLHRRLHATWPRRPTRRGRC